MKLLLLLFQNPGNGQGSPACNTPNPPYWCDKGEEVAANIDNPYWIIGLVIAAILLVVIKRKPTRFNRR